MALTTRKPLEVQVPFMGFYESIWSGMIDAHEEQWAEYEADYRQEEDGVPEELRLDASDYHTILFDVTDYPKCYRSIAESYAPDFMRRCEKAFGFKLSATFAALDSPKFYNYGTDRVFATIAPGAVRKLFAMSKRDKHAALAERVADRFTSRAGFSSSYDNDLDAWLSKPVKDWDHNEVGTLLLACMDIAGPDAFDLSSSAMREHDDIEAALEWEIYGDWVASGYHDWEHGVDWAQLAARVNKMRDAKAEALRNEGREVPPMRDADTLDMFNTNGEA